LPTDILDKPNEMGRIDRDNMLSLCIQAPKHYSESAKNAEKIKFTYPEPKNIIISGMGGSAIGGELLKDYTRNTAKVSIEVTREYHLPAYADKNSLVILASYSGDTEETLGAFIDAINRKCMIYCISSGGNLIKYAKKLNIPHLQVRGEMQPRAALPHMVLPMIKCMEKINMAPKVSEELVETIKLIEKISRDNAPEKPTSENFTKTLAVNLNKTVPVIYGSGIYRSVALRFKQQFNENAKIPAKWEYFSELNHNETMGWEQVKKLAKYFAIVLIRDKAEPLEISSRIEITKTLMQPNMPKILEVWVQGKTNLAKMLSTILIADFTSIYLALLRNLDPTPVNTVTTMKEKIEQNGVKQKILRELEKIAAK
jgi:glucose/mannose-6-phosphate isomerase